VASFAIRASLCGALRLCGTTDPARMEPLRLRRTAAEGLRLNAEDADFRRATARRTKLSPGGTKSPRYKCTLVGIVVALGDHLDRACVTIATAAEEIDPRRPASLATTIKLPDTVPPTRFGGVHGSVRVCPRRP